MLQAARIGNMAAITTMLDQGANPNERGMMGSTALIVAAEAGHEGVVRLLIVQGNVHAVNLHGDDALLVGAKAGHFAVVKLLTESGADPHRVSNSHGMPTNALLEACANDHLDVAVLLLSLGVDLLFSTRPFGNALKQYGRLTKLTYNEKSARCSVLVSAWQAGPCPCRRENRLRQARNQNWRRRKNFVRVLAEHGFLKQNTVTDTAEPSLFHIRGIVHHIIFFL